MRRSIFLLCLILVPALTFGQDIFCTATIDSFTATNPGYDRWFWGAACVDAVYENGAVHLSLYYRGNSTETVELMYGVRKSEGFEFDTVATLSPWEVSNPAGSAIHMDGSGNPWLFCDHRNRIFAYHRNGGNWISSFVDSSGYFKGMAAVERGGDEIGLVYLSNKGIRYASWNKGTWDTRTLFNKPDHGHFTRPSAVRSGDNICVSFAEGKDPDSIMVRVFSNSQGEWNEVFNDAYIASIGGVFMSERGLLGLTHEDQVHLWRQADGNSRYFIQTGSTWQSQPPTDPPNSFVKWPQGSNIVLSSDQTAFLLSQFSGFGPTVSWRKSDGSCGYNGEIPWLGYPCGITLFDQVMTPDDTLHIFYVYGYAASPYGDWDPVVFKETTVYVPDLLRSGTRVEHHDPSTEPVDFVLLQNYPNPFNPSTSIQFAVGGGQSAVRTTLKIYNILGQEVATLVDEVKQAGSYTVTWDGRDNAGSAVPSGVYVSVLTTGGRSTSKCMLLLR